MKQKGNKISVAKCKEGGVKPFSDKISNFSLNKNFVHVLVTLLMSMKIVISVTMIMINLLEGNEKYYVI